MINTSDIILLLITKIKESIKKCLYLLFKWIKDRHTLENSANASAECKSFKLKHCWHLFELNACGTNLRHKMCFVFDVNEDVDDAFVLDDDDDVDVGFVGATNIEAILINLFCYKPKSNCF